MINYENLINSLIEPLVVFAEDIKIESTDNEDGSVSLEVYVNANDLGRVIGKSGKIASAIRTILFAAATKEGKRVRVNINAL